jgi:adenylylsulfate kinase
LITPQSYTITKKEREAANSQKAFVLWLTGLSGAGKSTIADLTEQLLFSKNARVYVLDGDNIRNGISKDLGFSREDRLENIRRVAEIARLFCDAGLIVIAAFISPYDADRQLARTIIGKEHFVEVYVEAPLEECMRRDVKGLYVKAKEGLIKNFTGISDVYEIPKQPDIVLNTCTNSPQASVEKLILWLTGKNYIHV